MRYLKGTNNLSLPFGGEKPILVGFTNADITGDVDSRKSTSSYMVKFAERVVAWQSRLQTCVAFYTIETKFISTTETYKELLWMKNFLLELSFKQNHYVLFCDNQSVIHIGKNSIFHARSKHIDVRYHLIRDVLDFKLMELEKIHTGDNDADIMEKVLPRKKHEACCSIASEGLNLVEQGKIC